MTKSQKVEYVINGVGEPRNPSRWIYSLACNLLSLVASCKQRNRFVGFSLIPKYQKTAMSKTCKTHEASAYTYDAFDLLAKTFCSPFMASISLEPLFKILFCFLRFRSSSITWTSLFLVSSTAPVTDLFM